MEFTILQIVVTVFCAFALSRVFLRLKEHQLIVREAIFWAIIWVGAVIIVWIPSTAGLISVSLGLGAQKPIDTLVYMAIVLLFYLAYRTHTKHKQLEHQLTELVRQGSIHDAERRKSK